MACPGWWTLGPTQPPRPTQIRSYDKRLRLQIAAAIWIQQSYRIHPGFLHSIDAVAGATARFCDFEKHPTEACADVNAWAGQETNGLCGPILDPCSPESPTCPYWPFGKSVRLLDEARSFSVERLPMKQI